MNIHVRASVQSGVTIWDYVYVHTWSQMVTPPVNRNIDQSQTKFASSFFTGRRCHESLFHARIAV